MICNILILQNQSSLYSSFSVLKLYYSSFLVITKQSLRQLLRMNTFYYYSFTNVDIIDNGITAVGTYRILSKVAMKLSQSIIDLLSQRHNYWRHYLRYLDYLINAPYFEIIKVFLFFSFQYYYLYFLCDIPPIIYQYQNNNEQMGFAIVIYLNLIVFLDQICQSFNYCLNYNYMQISSQPYLKTYIFPTFSVAAFLKLILIILSVALPFFITYSTPNFYLTSHLSTNPNQPIAYNYKYHIEIVTSLSTYLYTNLYTYSPSKAIAVQQSDDKSVINFKLRWSKSNTDERVTRVHITLFFNYVTNGATQFGMTTGKISGYNIAQGSIAGYLTIEPGTGQSIITQNNLTLNGYNLLTTQLQMSQSRNFLNYQYSSLPVNLPSDLVSISMIVNYGSFLSSNDTPSVLGQLVWSWIQYFPIFLTIYWILDKAFCFLLSEKIVRSTTVHDKQYLHLIEQQNSRRQRLRLK